MFTVVDSETLVFPADEDGREDVTTTNELLVQSPCEEEGEENSHENSQTNIVCSVVVYVIETSEADQTDPTCNGKDNRKA